MSNLLPEGFEPPKGTALTIVIKDVNAYFVIEQGTGFEVEGDRSGLHIQRQPGVFLIQAGLQPRPAGVHADRGSVSVGGSIHQSTIVTGHGNQVVSMGGGDGGYHHSKRQTDHTYISSPSPLALVLVGSVRRVRCYLPLTVLHLEGFKGTFEGRDAIQTLTGPLAGPGQYSTVTVDL